MYGPVKTARFRERAESAEEDLQRLRGEDTGDAGSGDGDGDGESLYSEAEELMMVGEVGCWVEAIVALPTLEVGYLKYTSHGG